MATDPEADSLAAAHRRDRACDRFEKAWLAGNRPSLAEAVAAAPEADRAGLFADLVRLEVHYRRRGGEDSRPADYAGRFPEYVGAVAAAFAATTPFEPPPPEPPRPPGRFAAGEVVAGRYRIVARVGAGGMGEVYRADDLELGGPVALKFLPPARTADPEWVARLKQEVAVARRVTHENVCRVHDLGDAAGQPFLVMEYVDGRSLADLRRLVRRFDPEQVTNYARQLCDGLAAVHDRGLLHRDLKPANVLIDADGRLLLADFGLAAAAADVGADEAGAGTVAYMAPEQLAAVGVSARSDLFALGLILFELATGERPFPGTTRADLARQYAAGPPRPSTLAPGLDPALDAVVVRCLAADPHRRPALAAEVKAALPPLSPRKTADRGGSGRLRPAVAVGLFVAALVGLLAHAWAADHTMAYRRLPPAKSRASLRDTAAGIAGNLDPTKRPPPVDEDSGFDWDLERVHDVARHAPAGWDRDQDGRSPLVYFWYRASPIHHVPAAQVNAADPPLTTPGMVSVLLDPKGRLIEYHAVPGREPSAHLAPATREHWEGKLLAEAGLDRARFAPALLSRRPPCDSDDAWGLAASDAGLRADFAVCDGRPVYFRVWEPTAGGGPPKDRVEGQNVAAQGKRNMVASLAVVVVILATLAAVPLAVRNWRLGRADLRGAALVCGGYAAVTLVGWVSTSPHTTSLQAERVAVMTALGVAVFWAVLLAVCYLAVEPAMRRRWPERLASWNRLLAGRPADPLVGRDVLLGVVVGTVAAVPPKLAAAALGTYYLISPLYSPLPPDVSPGFFLSVLSVALIRTATVFVLLLLFGVLLRRDWAAVAAIALLAVPATLEPQATLPRESPVTLAAIAAGAAVLTAAAVRFGWLAALASMFTSTVLHIAPLTLTPQGWYAGTTVATAVVLVGLAVYGFVVSLGGQRIIPDEF
ncbi:serine/threonine-protein kinase [Urbifossiella limnaea]|uniref:serine/threonine-protein kinase n=1 Tax=Urbifossiella limnaea TaxID=2528023 RepID=UPI0011A92046|nr:serine/threonine-protein kinase [Urbifossiella limnaea]